MPNIQGTLLNNIIPEARGIPTSKYMVNCTLVNVLSTVSHFLHIHAIFGR
jgi:hypothetical protein